MYVAIFRVDRSLVYAENGIDSFIWRIYRFIDLAYRIVCSNNRCAWNLHTICTKCKLCINYLHRNIVEYRKRFSALILFSLLL